MFYGLHVICQIHFVESIKVKELSRLIECEALSVHLLYRARILQKVERNAAITRTRNPSVKGKTQESCSLSRSTGILPAPAAACITRFYYAVNCSDCCVSLAISGSRSTRAPYLCAFLFPSPSYLARTFDGPAMRLFYFRRRQENIHRLLYSLICSPWSFLRALLSISPDPLAEIYRHYVSRKVKGSRAELISRKIPPKSSMKKVGWSALPQTSYATQRFLSGLIARTKMA